MRSLLWQEGQWQVLIESGAQHHYFYNTETKETTWLPPPALVAASRLRTSLYNTQDWQVLQDTRGKPYYYNRPTKVSTWTPPAGLPEYHEKSVKHGRLLLQAIESMAARILAEEESEVPVEVPVIDIDPLLDMLADVALDPVVVWSQQDAQGRNAFMGACALGLRKIVKKMLVYAPPLEQRDKEGWTALGLMALSGESTGVQDLMEAGADVTCKNGEGFYIWEAALDAGFGAISKIIKDKHAGINQAMVADRKAAKEKSRTTTYSTIFEAAAAGHSGQLQWFLVTNPELLNAQSREGYTVLMIVSRSGYWMAVDALVRGGADLSVVDAMGWTACMHAAACNQSRTVSYLLAAGADPGVVSKAGLTALQLTSCPLVKDTLEGALGLNPLSPRSPRPIVLHTRGKERTLRGVLFVEAPPSVFSYDNGPEEGEGETTVTLEFKPQFTSPQFSTPPPPIPSEPPTAPPPNLPTKIKLERKPIAPAPAPKKKPTKF